MTTVPFYSNHDKAAPNLVDADTPCRNNDPEMWFAESDSKALTAEQLEAKRLCDTCPVRLACLEKAFDNHEEWGIWGGLTPKERRDIRPKQKRSQRQPINHGTEGGYKQHQRRKDKACEPCTRASNLAKRARVERAREDVA